VSTLKEEVSLKDYEGFIIFNEDQEFDIPADELGKIEIKDSGLTIICDYETVVNLAKIEAQKMGANCLKIYEHREPNAFSSTCHRIKAKAYKIKDISPYETQIIWNAQRRLELKDFKGTIENRPFEAATYSGIKYYARALHGKIIINVEAQFNCLNSYFKGSNDVEDVLEHEQGHFDMTEIYARKLRKLFTEQISSVKDFETMHEALYKRNFNELQLAQDRYDSQIIKMGVYSNNGPIKFSKILKCLRSLKSQTLQFLQKPHKNLSHPSNKRIMFFFNYLYF
jgi:hypothetical protein